MVGGWRPGSRALPAIRPLLAGLPRRQQAQAGPLNGLSVPLTCPLQVFAGWPWRAAGRATERGCLQLPDAIFQGWAFSWAKVAFGPCGLRPPSYMRLTVAISR